MKIEKFSPETQAALRQWATDKYHDELLFDDNASSPEFWAWTYFQLWESEDRPEWFPKGKSATIQCLGNYLLAEARESLRDA